MKDFPARNNPFWASSRYRPGVPICAWRKRAGNQFQDRCRHAIFAFYKLLSHQARDGAAKKAAPSLAWFFNLICVWQAYSWYRRFCLAAMGGNDLAEKLFCRRTCLQRCLTGRIFLVEALCHGETLLPRKFLTEGCLAKQLPYEGATGWERFPIEVSATGCLFFCFVSRRR